MNNFFSKYKFIFYLFNFFLILLYLYPGSLLGCFLYDDCKLQPQITGDFIVSTNHLYAFALFSIRSHRPRAMHPKELLRKPPQIWVFESVPKCFQHASEVLPNIHLKCFGNASNMLSKSFQNATEMLWKCFGHASLFQNASNMLLEMLPTCF